MYERFTNMYRISKTLRFGLIPQGKTLEHIEKKGILAEDQLRSELKGKVQALADGYHKRFIEDTLTGFTLGHELEEYAEAYLHSDRHGDASDDLDALRDAMIKQISAAFTESKDFKQLFTAKLFTQILPEMYQDDPEAMATLDFFKGFNTYFTGYHKNRMLLYDADGKFGTVAGRLVVDNLPVFLDNHRKFSMIAEAAPEIIEKAEEELAALSNGYDIEEAFSITGFNDVLTQTGIDRYNQLIGGYSNADDSRVQGLNERINLFCQQNKDVKLPLLTQLKKQMLSERSTLSFVPEAFSDDEELIGSLLEFDKLITPAAAEMAELLAGIDKYDPKGIYIKRDVLSEISNTLFDSWHHINDLLEARYDALQNASEKKRSTVTYKKTRENALRKIKEYRIDELDMLPGIDGKLSKYVSGAAGFAKGSIDMTRAEFLKSVQDRSDADRSLKRDSRAKAAIKNYLDSLIEMRRLAASLEVTTGEKDMEFYDRFDALMDTIRSIPGIYNKTRNYLSGKLYTNEKIKLNFGSAAFLDGWSESVESTKLGTILLRDGDYYFGIIAKGQGDLFAKLPDAETDDVYMKMRYNVISGANKALPHSCFSQKGIETYKPSEEVLRIYKEGTFKKGPAFSISDCHKLIDYFKSCISQNKAWDCYDFDFSDTSSYEDINGFYREVDAAGYSLRYRPIDREVIDRLVENGQLYLFRIWHKDFSTSSKGKPDLSTIYWRAIFDPRNRENPVYKLNGGAEMFYRKASIKDADIIRHKAGDTVKAKNPLSEKQSRVLKYDIVKDRRFTVDKFQLNVPVTINSSAPDFSFINTDARLAIKRNEGVHVIGVSRGENSLIQICVLDPEGRIVEKKNLNVIETTSGERVCRTDYARLLEEREAARMQERKSWESVENIKQLKSGYISQVVRILADLMIKYNAVIAIEDLNVRFKQSRQKIEKAVYQQLEQKLITKLNFLVNKDADPDAPGGTFNGYQLTAPFQSFDRIGRQTGFIFYVSPWKTTEIDPKTGFVNRFDTRYTNLTAAKAFWHSFDAIAYDGDIGAFRFDFDYTYFLSEDAMSALEGTQTKWSVFSHGNRTVPYRTDKGTKYRDTDITEAIRDLLEEHGVDPEDGDIRDTICAVSDKAFHEQLLDLFGSLVKMRSGTEIISPVMEPGRKSFFSAPSDENGAYCIARKGLMIVDRIKAASEEELTATAKSAAASRKAGENAVLPVSLSVSGNEWLQEMQK